MPTTERTKVTVREIVLGLIAFSTERGVKSFPPNGDRLWHLLLYQIREELGSKFPELEIGRFNWDNSYPTHSDLGTIYMATLSWCGMEWSGRLTASQPDLRYSLCVEPFFANPRLAEEVFNRAREVRGFFTF